MTEIEDASRRAHRAKSRRSNNIDLLRRSRLLTVWHHQLTALARVECDMIEEARAPADEAARIAFASGMNGEAVHGSVRQGLVLSKMGLPGEAHLATRRGTDMLLDLGTVRRAEEVWWIQALTLERSGNPLRAEMARKASRAEVDRKSALITDPRLRTCYDNHPLIHIIQNS